MNSHSAQNRQNLYQSLSHHTEFSHELTKCLLEFTMGSKDRGEPSAPYSKVKQHLLQLGKYQSSKNAVMADLSMVVKGGQNIFDNLQHIATTHGQEVSIPELKYAFDKLMEKLNYEGLVNDQTRTLNLRHRQGKKGIMFSGKNQNSERRNPLKMHVFASSKSPSYNRVIVSGGNRYSRERVRNITPPKNVSHNTYMTGVGNIQRIRSPNESRSPIIRQNRSQRVVNQIGQPSPRRMKKELTLKHGNYGRSNANLFSRPSSRLNSSIDRNNRNRTPPTYYIGEKTYGQPYERSPNGEYTASRSPIQRYRRPQTENIDYNKSKSPLVLRRNITPNKSKSPISRKYQEYQRPNNVVNKSKSPLHRKIFTNTEQERPKPIVVQLEPEKYDDKEINHGLRRNLSSGFNQKYPSSVTSQRSKQVKVVRQITPPQSHNISQENQPSMIPKRHTHSQNSFVRRASPIPSNQSSFIQNNSNLPSHHTQERIQERSHTPKTYGKKLTHQESVQYQKVQHPRSNVVYNSNLNNREKLQVVQAAVSPKKPVVQQFNRRFVTQSELNNQPSSRPMTSKENERSISSSHRPREFRKITGPYQNDQTSNIHGTTGLTPAQITMQRVQASIVSPRPVQNNKPLIIENLQPEMNPTQFQKPKYTPYSHTMKDYSHYKSPSSTVNKVDIPKPLGFNDPKKETTIQSPIVTRKSHNIEPRVPKTNERNIDPYSRSIKSRYPLQHTESKPSAKTGDIESSRTNILDQYQFKNILETKDSMQSQPVRKVKKQIQNVSDIKSDKNEVKINLLEPSSSSKKEQNGRKMNLGSLKSKPKSNELDSDQDIVNEPNNHQYGTTLNFIFQFWKLLLINLESP